MDLAVRATPRCTSSGSELACVVNSKTDSIVAPARSLYGSVSRTCVDSGNMNPRNFMYARANGGCMFEPVSSN